LSGLVRAKAEAILGGPGGGAFADFDAAVAFLQYKVCARARVFAALPTTCAAYAFY
jgi:hypothetical protein